MTPQAHLIISGKALEHDFPLCDLETLVASIEKELLSRGTTLTRRAVTLGAERQIAAPLFLSAGFETLPADDEDVQASTTILSTAFGLASPDEIAFLLGFESEPICFLRSLAGRVKRTPILLGSSARNAPSPTMRRASENLLYLADSAAKIGVDWSQIELGNWKYWERQFELALGALDSQETLAIARQEFEESLCDADETQERELGEESLCDADEAQERESGDDYNSVYDLTLGIEIPEGEEEFVSDPVLDGAIVFAENANEWNEELESYLREQGLICSAWLAVDKLDRHFKGISNFYMSDREGFKKLLSSNIRLIEEEQGNLNFYHIEHPEMRAPSLANLTFDVDKEESVEKLVFEPSMCVVYKTFHDVAERVALHAEESRWMCKRDSLLSSPEVYARDSEIRERGKELGVFFWQLSTPQLSPEAFSKMAACYDLLYDALMMMDKVASEREVLPKQIVIEAMEALANAHCLVKTGLRGFGVPLANDWVQYHAYLLLKNFREKYYPSHIMNLKLDSRIELSELRKVRKEYECVAEKVDSFLDAYKKRVDVEKKLKYHLEKITGDSVDSDHTYDWNVVIQCVTDLVVKFNVPYSSLFFRDTLGEQIYFVPEKANVTVEFEGVAQEIDNFYVLDWEREIARFQSSSTERVFSENVLAVREYLAGGQIVFIGGTPKAHMRERIEKAFGVKMNWEVLSHSVSLERLVPYLRDPDVKLFLVYIPQCSHKHSEEFISQYTKPWGKEAVRILSGTNPEQIAVTIIEQLHLKPKRVEE